MSGLNRLVEEDPTLSYRRDEQTREIILSGMGQVHIEIAVEKMKRKFGVEVTLTTPKVPYKETLKGKTTVQGTCLPVISSSAPKAIPMVAPVE